MAGKRVTNSVGQMKEPPDKQATDALRVWCGIASLLLTGGGAWRKSGGVTKAIGFPTTSKREKPRFQALLAALEDCETFRARLYDLRTLPPASFDAQQWEVLESLVALLGDETVHLGANERPVRDEEVGQRTNQAPRPRK